MSLWAPGAGQSSLVERKQTRRKSEGPKKEERKRGKQRPETQNLEKHRNKLRKRRDGKEQ